MKLSAVHRLIEEEVGVGLKVAAAYCNFSLVGIVSALKRGERERDEP
jgi:hypothetical protein